MNVRPPCICLVTDRRRLTPDARTVRDGIVALERWLDDAIDQIDLIQIREPDLGAGHLCGLVQRVTTRTRGSRTAVVVNDRADVALAAHADGVHVKSAGPPTSRVRALGPAAWLVGRSTHSVAEVRREDAPGYLMFGTVFPTASKPAATAGGLFQGIDGLAGAVQAAHVPVLAIGGMTPERAPQCMAVGAAGVAAIAVFLPPERDPAGLGLLHAATAFRKAMIG